MSSAPPTKFWAVCEFERYSGNSEPRVAIVQTYAKAMELADEANAAGASVMLKEVSFDAFFTVSYT